MLNHKLAKKIRLVVQQIIITQTEVSTIISTVIFNCLIKSLCPVSRSLLTSWCFA